MFAEFSCLVALLRKAVKKTPCIRLSGSLFYVFWWNCMKNDLSLKMFLYCPGRASSGSRLSAFVQISALFQIYMSRHLHHLTKCPFEVKKGLKGLFLHWEVIANKQTLPYFVFPCNMSFVAFTCFFGLVLMQTFMQKLRILFRYCTDFCTKKCSKVDPMMR